MCKKLKENNINVVIDTAGNFNITDKVKELLKYVDLVMLDVKHIDDNTHTYLTGSSNEKILNFGRYLSDNNIPVRIRIVYLPTITDDKEENIIKLKEYIKNIKTLEKVEVLPYHTMGISKWKELGLKYELNELKEPTKEKLISFENYLKI